MLEEENQNSKEQEKTLNLTGKELEEYKTYLKFKNEIEKQNESQEDVQVKSQNITQNQSQGKKANADSEVVDFDKEIGITDIDDPNYTFTEEELDIMGYKKNFIEPLNVMDIESRRKSMVSGVLRRGVYACIMFYSSRNLHGIGWSITKIAVAVTMINHIISVIKRLIVVEPINSLESKFEKYNKFISGASYVNVSDNDIAFKKFYDISKDTIENKLHLINKKPKFMRDKYTKIFHIVDSDVFIVFGIYDSSKMISSGCVSFMLVLEGDVCLLNLVGDEVLRKKK